MTDINKVELSVGDYVLVAFSQCGAIRLVYATITKIDGTDMKVRFSEENRWVGKTRTLHMSNSQCLKIRGND